MKSITILFFSISILTFTSCRGINEMPRNKLITPKIILQNDTLPDSVAVIATDKYKAGFIKKAWQGSGYREAWQTPIKVPVVNLDTAFGGLAPVEKGGGDQTLSLELTDSIGNNYTLRSVNKDPSSLVPDYLKKLKMEGLVTDAISAQHPYGAVALAPMADALGLWHTHPRVIYLPSQEDVLDSFNQDFKDRLLLLEYETSGEGTWTNLDNICEITSTENMQELGHGRKDFTIDTANLVRARLFDLVIGDWDRHAKNWGWIISEKPDGSMLATVLACDRDNVFYGIGGVFPSIVNRPFIQPLLRPFKKKIDHLPGMIKPFDSYFLYQVDVSIFLKEAAYIQEHLTDEIMEESLRQWPPQFYDLNGEEIIEKMKARRDDLHKYAAEIPVILNERGPLEEALKGSTNFGRMMGKKKRTRVD